MKYKFTRNELWKDDNFFIEWDCKCPKEWKLFVNSGNCYEEVRKGDIGYEDVYKNTLNYSWFKGMTVPQVLSVVGKNGYYYSSNENISNYINEELSTNNILRQTIKNVISTTPFMVDKEGYVDIDDIIKAVNDFLKESNQNIKLNYSSLFHLVTTDKSVNYRISEDMEKIKIY